MQIEQKKRVRATEHNYISKSMALLLVLVMMYLASCAANGQNQQQVQHATPEPVTYSTPAPSANQQLFFEIFNAVQQDAVSGLEAVTGIYKVGISKETYAALFFDGTVRKVTLPDGRTFFLPLLPTDPTAPLEPCGGSETQLLQSELVYQIPGVTGFYAYQFDRLFVAWDNPDGSFPGMFDWGDYVDTVACVQRE